jgi:5'-deoxynucleotidase YfbR-like HD superfamily hydrolase
VKHHPVVLDPRRAGRVLRYHTWPHIRPQTVAEHCWQATRILMAMWPDVPPHLIRHMMFHDVGEVVTGDPPYPLKSSSPTLKAALDGVESDAHLAMCLPWGLPAPLKLAEAEAVVTKLADLIEMWEWGLDEVALGSHEAELVVTRCRDAFVVLADRLEPDHPARAGYERYVARRITAVTASRRAHP